MTQTTSEKIALVMRELRARRSRGEIAADGKVSTGQMASLARELGAPVSEVTFRRIELIALTKLRLAVFHIIETDPSLSDLIDPTDS